MHETLIDELGGTRVVAEYCGVALNVASNWRERGISWKYRPKVAELAASLKVKLPREFFDPEAMLA